MLAAIPRWQSIVLVIERLLTPGRFPNWQCVVSLGKTLHAYFPLGSTDRAVYPLWWPSSRNTCKQQRWSRGHKARGQGQGHKKKSEAKAKDSLSEDRHSRGQGQECSRPRPRTKDTKRKCSPKKKKRSLQKFFRRSPKKKKKKKKKVFTKIFQAISTKKRFPKNFSSAPQNFNIPKNSAVLEPRTGQFSRT